MMEVGKVYENRNGKYKVLDIINRSVVVATYIDPATSDNQLVWLSHYAHRAWPKSHQGAYHLFGHTHGVMPPYRRSRDAGVDANNYSPLSFDELDQWASKLVLQPDEIERDMLAHPWPKLDHLPEGSH